MGALRRVNGGIEKVQWGHSKGSMGVMVSIHWQCLDTFFLTNQCTVSMFFTNLNSMKGLGAGFK